MIPAMLDTARRLGKRAGQQAQPVTSCPYSTQGGPDQRAAARTWVAAWLRWSPPKSVRTDFDEDEGADLVA